MKETVTIDAIFGMPIQQLMEMEKAELQQLLFRCELLCRWLRGVLRLKSKQEGQ